MSPEISPISRRHIINKSLRFPVDPNLQKSSQRKLRRRHNQRVSKKILMHHPLILKLKSGLNIENLVAELHKATSETVVEKTGHSDSLNKSVQQEVHRAIEEEPIMDRPLTPATQYSIGAEVLNALRWLIDLLNAPIDQNVDHEVVQQKADLVTVHFRKYYVPEEAAPVEGVPLLVKNLVNTASNLKNCQNRVVDLGKDLKLLDKTTSDYDKVKSQLSIERQIKEVEDQKEKLEGPLSRSKQGLKKINDKLASIADQKKTTQEQLSDLKRAEKDELELHEKFLENKRSTRMALEDILHEYTS
ncbi:hypothetical protein PIB30_064570 [Stylosanthes scabra]|uniref:Uncharacterized protein n=1 Tax=Stylosanthes scabra TaxID=79078 RepID=A0ABU6SMK7_9FABA|nr:hypothetical protein [Stylosanthes scabra]